MVKKVLYSLGSLAAILLLSGVISIIEYRRMSDYVSELIAANIKSINLAQKLSDITEEYNHQMLSVVVQNDISLMPEFDLEWAVRWSVPDQPPDQCVHSPLISACQSLITA